MIEPLYSADEMRAAEALYPGYPDTAPELMERAGRPSPSTSSAATPNVRRVTAVCGGGANGGDARIAAQLLAQSGREVTIVDAASGGDLGSPDVIVDGLFGTGFRGEPRPEAATLIEAMNADGAPIVAVDIPSGVDASSGEVAGAAVHAELTVTFHGRKVGLAVAPGRFHAGEVVVADIGLEPAETEHRFVTPELLGLVPRRGAGDNKYSAGSVLVVGGSPGLTGAVCLAAEAAFRADAGYVTVAAPPASLPMLEARLLEAVKRPLDEVEDAAARAGALALGPGLGREPEAHALVRRLLTGLELPAVVDADGLFGLEPFQREAATVLTPHAGELGRLLGEESAWVSAHRLEAVRRAADRFRLCRAPQGRRHPGRGARRGRARLRLRPSVARDGRDRRRAHGHRGGVSRQGSRAASRGRRGRRRARARRRERPRAGRSDRERRDPGAAAGARCTALS